MNIKQAAQNTLIIWAKNLSDVPLPEPERDPNGRGRAHQVWLLHSIIAGQVEGEKAHRWLSYAQGYLVCLEDLKLDDCKYANVFA
jgi:hypothetical protein